jgi:hypothetical protein
MSSHVFKTGRRAGKRHSHIPPVTAPKFTAQADRFVAPQYPFQPLPPPNGPSPYRFDLSQLLSAADIKSITDAGVLAIHTVGDTGDSRGQQQDFVALGSGLTLEQYDQDNFGFLRLEVSKTQIVGTYFSAPYSAGNQPAATRVESFAIDLIKNTVQTLP